MNRRASDPRGVEFWTGVFADAMTAHAPPRDDAEETAVIQAMLVTAATCLLAPPEPPARVMTEANVDDAIVLAELMHKAALAEIARRNLR